MIRRTVTTTTYHSGGTGRGSPTRLSMMDRYSSMSSGTKKKHKCKVCDKRLYDQLHYKYTCMVTPARSRSPVRSRVVTDHPLLFLTCDNTENFIKAKTFLASLSMRSEKVRPESFRKCHSAYSRLVLHHLCCQQPLCLTPAQDKVSSTSIRWLERASTIFRYSAQTLANGRFLVSPDNSTSSWA